MLIRLDPLFTFTSNDSKDTVIDFQDVIAAGQSRGGTGLLLDDAVQLAESGQRSGAHPHDEVLVDEAVVVSIVRVQLVHRPPPVHRLSCA